MYLQKNTHFTFPVPAHTHTNIRSHHDSPLGYAGKTVPICRAYAHDIYSTPCCSSSSSPPYPLAVAAKRGNGEKEKGRHWSPAFSNRDLSAKETYVWPKETYLRPKETPSVLPAMCHISPSSSRGIPLYAFLIYYISDI